MKIGIKQLIILMTVACVSSCSDLDLVQQDAASLGNWYSNENQFRQSVNELYRTNFWLEDSRVGWNDDSQARTDLDGIQDGSMNSEFSEGASRWQVLYKGITRANVTAEAILNQNGVLSEQSAISMLAEVDFNRATYWTYLITHFGNVPFYEHELSIDESFELPQTDKYEILQHIYDYYDFAAENLPLSYSGTEFATKGAAYALKARAALYMGDYETAAVAAKNVMDLNVYELHSDYANLFLPETKSSKEIIFKISRSLEYNDPISSSWVKRLVPRTLGGFGNRQPTWQLLAAYESVDGLPIDESPLFDPRNPFKNRDPRLLETIVPFGSLEEGDGRTADQGTVFLGMAFTPHPVHKEVMSYESGKMIKNSDTRSLDQWASFNGLYWKKSINGDWKDLNTDPDKIIIRYADVLLMYAEAKIELNDIDQSVLKAINMVRDRAYAHSTFSNPEVKTLEQQELRYIVRNERRVELAMEGLRYMDLIRWRLAEKAMSANIYGMLNIDSNTNVDVEPEGELMDKVVNPGLWFWGITPEIDKDGIAHFDALYEAGLCRILNTMSFSEKQYLWPIPHEEILLNENLEQNPGY